jgi:hypothetical protein
MSRHPSPELNAVVEYAIAQGWRVIQSKKGHAWGRVLCPHNERNGCIHSVNSTPRNPGSDARRLRRLIDNCPHQQTEENNDE